MKSDNSEKKNYKNLNRTKIQMHLKQSKLVY